MEDGVASRIDLLQSMSVWSVCCVCSVCQFMQIAKTNTTELE